MHELPFFYEFDVSEQRPPFDEYLVLFYVISGKKTRDFDAG